MKVIIVKGPDFERKVKEGYEIIGDYFRKIVKEGEEQHEKTTTQLDSCTQSNRNH